MLEFTRDGRLAFTSNAYHKCAKVRQGVKAKVWKSFPEYLTAYSEQETIVL